MDTARRLYLYLVSGVGLAAFAAGVVTLSAIILGELAPGRADVLSGGFVTREQVSRSIALIIVGLPVWLLHWEAVRRSVRGPDGLAERTSALRAVYLAAVRVITISLIAGDVFEIVRWGMSHVVGVTPGWVDVASITARLAVALPLFLYHGRVAAADARLGVLHGAAAWIPRLARHAIAFVALATVLTAASSLIMTSYGAVLGTDVLGSPDWWRQAIADTLPSLLIGLGVWWVAWRDTIADSALLGPGEDERASRVRGAYFGGMTLVAASVGCGALVVGITAFADWVLGARVASGTLALLEQVIGPAIAIIPFVASAWLHQRRQAGELAAIGHDPAAPRRVSAHIVALVGLVALTSGMAELLRLLTEALAGQATLLAGGGQQADTTALAVGLIAAGALTWVPAWAIVLRARSLAPSEEAGSTASGVHLALVVAVAFLALVPAAIALLFRIVDTALGGVADRPLGAELATPIAIMLIAVPVAAYHGRLLIHDRRLVASTTRAGQPDSRPTAAGSSLDVTIVLHLASDADVQDIVDRLRVVLAQDATLELQAVRPSQALSATGGRPVAVGG